MNTRRPLYQFAHRLLPEKFFQQPERWMTRLGASGGKKLLQALWSSQDACYEHHERMAPTDLHYYFDSLHSDWRLVVVEFEKPCHSFEPYFAAMAWRPAQLLFLVFPRRSQAARYYVVQREENSENGVLIEWKEDGTYTKHGALSALSTSSFIEALHDLTFE